MCKQIAVLLALIGVFGLVSVANADLISASSVALLQGTSPDEPIANASNGVTTDYWYTVERPGGTGYFTGMPIPILWLDLGEDKMLDGVAFWNYVSAGNSVKNFDLLFFTDADPNPFGQTTFTATAGPPAGATDPESLPFSGTVTARYVQMTLTSNYGGSRVGFKEIQFSTVVPEPGTITLLATGLIGLLCYAWRKRK